MAYSEQEKNVAREQVIRNAVRILTTDRASATLARRSYVREAKTYLAKSGSASDSSEAGRLSVETIKRWEDFYDSIVQTRKAVNLKVAYLSGPNPENDLRVLVQAGVLPENIWAFESDAKTYDQAVQSALASEFPFIKLVQGGIDNFLTVSPQKFDIIYLDFCGPLPNRNKKQKTLLAVTKTLAKHALNSPGVLITNASLPTQDQDPAGRSLTARLVAAYLYPKSFLENGGNSGGLTDGAQAMGMEFDDWLVEVENKLDDYYGQYLTRLLMDHVSVIVPAGRYIPGEGVFNRLFDTTDEASLQAAIDTLFHFNESVLSADDTDDDADNRENDESGDQNEARLGGDVISDAGEYPLLWTIAALDEKIRAGDTNYPALTTDPEFKKFAELFMSQLSVTSDKNSLISSLSAMAFLLSEGTGSDKFHSAKLAEIADQHRFGQYYQFCDLVLFHQLKELLFRQWAVPYHVNVKESMRWTYQAKDTPMFMDLLVIDECRYIYDWMPTVDMLLASVLHKERQLSFRFALDSVSKHRRWYNPEYFEGTAVIDQGTVPFEAKELNPRIRI